MVRTLQNYKLDEPPILPPAFRSYVRQEILELRHSDESSTFVGISLRYGTHNLSNFGAAHLRSRNLFGSTIRSAF